MLLMLTICKRKNSKARALFDLYPEDQAQTYLEDDLKVIESSEPKLFIEEPWETEKGKRWVSTSKIPLLMSKETFLE